MADENKYPPCPFCGGKAVFYQRRSGQDVSQLVVYHEYDCYFSIINPCPISAGRRYGDTVPLAVDYFHWEA